MRDGVIRRKFKEKEKEPTFQYVVKLLKEAHEPIRPARFAAQMMVMKLRKRFY